MADKYGLQIFGAGGTLLLDTTDRLPKYIASYTGTVSDLRSWDDPKVVTINVPNHYITADGYAVFLAYGHNREWGKMVGYKITGGNIRLEVIVSSLLFTNASIKYFVTVFKL